MAVATSQQQQHDYRFCGDDACPRFPCRVYKQGYADGYESGRLAGYMAGYADGYSEGYGEGYAAGSEG